MAKIHAKMFLHFGTNALYESRLVFCSPAVLIGRLIAAKSPIWELFGPQLRKHAYFPDKMLFSRYSSGRALWSSATL